MQPNKGEGARPIDYSYDTRFYLTSVVEQSDKMQDILTFMRFFSGTYDKRINHEQP